jgi:signal transduction histidine kinase
MLYIIISVIAGLSLFLLLKLRAIKKELRRIKKEMTDKTDESILNVDFVDSDLQDMILEVNRLYGNITEIKRESKRQERAIRDSVSMISHDMRTPLTSVIGYLQMAKRSEDPAEIDENITTALERAQYLKGLINDFFELSLIGSGQTRAVNERLNLSEMICEEILAQSPEIDARGIEPGFGQADTNIYVQADRKMLTRVIQNLLSNSVKYTRGRLDIAIEEQGSRTAFRIVTDTSGEIAADRIFDMFYMEDASRHKGGTGLGLYIVKEFVENMGGSIHAEQNGEAFIMTVELQSDGKQQIIFYE